MNGTLANGEEPAVEHDYVSPNLVRIDLAHAFPNMIVGDKSASTWPYLRRTIRHHWYVDRRHPTAGFLGLDEAMIAHNLALSFAGRPCLEIGCWRGWSAAHIARATGELYVVDPHLFIPEFRADVAGALARAGAGERVWLNGGYSPDAVEQMTSVTGLRWAFAFIDGDHDGEAPRRDAYLMHHVAADDALLLFHDLMSPDVAAALLWLRDAGWHVAYYNTMQIMGVAWRGNTAPVPHLPDPAETWDVPPHLASVAQAPLP